MGLGGHGLTVHENPNECAAPGGPRHSSTSATTAEDEDKREGDASQTAMIAPMTCSVGPASLTLCSPRFVVAIGIIKLWRWLAAGSFLRRVRLRCGDDLLWGCALRQLSFTEQLTQQLIVGQPDAFAEASVG